MEHVQGGGPGPPFLPGSAEPRTAASPSLVNPEGADGPPSATYGAPALGANNNSGIAPMGPSLNKKSQPKGSKKGSKEKTEGLVPDDQLDVNRQKILKNLEATIASVVASQKFQDNMPSPASTASISSRMGDLDLESSNDLQALSPEEEARAAEEARKADLGPLATDEVDGDDNGEPPAKKSYAEAAKPARGYEVLYIHYGDKERLPIDKDLFYKLWDKVNLATFETMQKGVYVPDNILWRSWSQNRGLVAVGDKATSDHICALIRTIKVKKSSFRAWHREEFSEGRLVTGFVTGQGLKHIPVEEVVRIILHQNRLKGAIMGASAKETEGGRLIRFFADPGLWADLLARREDKKKRTVRLKLAMSLFMAHLSREKGENKGEGEAADSQKSQSGAADSGEAAPPPQDGH